MNRNYQLGLLHLVHLLIGVDGVTDVRELEALCKIKTNEKIADDILAEFEETKSDKSEKELYDIGLEHLQQCSDEEKLKIFSTLYCLSEIDGRVHVKEIRLLLYSIKSAGIDFNDVVHYAKSNPTMLT
ncbi:hypothetical protein [Chryseolinea lacunae]|uniref:Co-chaperone DjlA N-terminal domain-containing protein n=1 Tax=Chryseolinea lacunae TaxID=2801331 RepID=A0ABS1KQF4_9BACT|nr:hypothetical protein [Chryseolinea lacunae]MBL0741704.1 hypothetical protein [Chryseolinea lacunae]